MKPEAGIMNATKSIRINIRFKKLTISFFKSSTKVINNTTQFNYLRKL